jgi:hypothetical protein
MGIATGVCAGRRAVPGRRAGARRVGPAACGSPRRQTGCGALGRGQAVGWALSGLLAVGFPQGAWAADKFACWGENPSGCKESTLSVNQGDARVSDKIKHTGEDLRKYNFTVGDARGVDFSGSNFQGAYLMKGVFFQAKFDNSDMSNTLDDRSVFTEASFVNANLTNAVFTRSDLTGAVVTGADFTGAIIDKPMVGKLCRDPNTKGTNPVTGVDTRASLGCPKSSGL